MGAAVSPDELDMLLEKLHYLARGAEFVVFAGSLPRGVDDRLLRRGDPGARPARRPASCSTREGEPLRLGIEAEP